jgi:hypothetical protein
LTMSLIDEIISVDQHHHHHEIFLVHPIVNEDKISVRLPESFNQKKIQKKKINEILIYRFSRISGSVIRVLVI